MNLRRWWWKESYGQFTEGDGVPYTRRILEGPWEDHLVLYIWERQ